MDDRFLAERKKEVILFVVSSLLFLGSAFVLTRQKSVLIHSDFYSRWYPSRMKLLEQRSIYDPKNSEEVVAINPEPIDPIFATFAYPATLLVFTLPLAFMEFPAAHFFWLFFIQICSFLGVYILSKAAGWPRAVNGLTVMLLLSILFIPNMQNTIWGQFNTIGVLFLALAYRALLEGKYAQAGLWAAGLTFKPQTMLLTLVLLLAWAIFERRRWPLLSGFFGASLVLWGFAEIIEPGWIIGFYKGSQVYLNYSGLFDPSSALEFTGIPGMWLPAGLLLITAVVFLVHRKAEAGSPAMTGWLVLSAATWWLVVPIIGMMHMVLLPGVLVILFSVLSREYPQLERLGEAGILLLYGLGAAGFLYGLASPESYGLHIRLSELAYKVAAPIFTAALTFPLVIRARRQASLA